MSATARPAARPAARPRSRQVARPAPVRRPRLAVVPERIARRSRVPFLALIGLVLVLGVGGLLLFNTWMQQSAFTVTDLQDRANTLEARQQSLSMALQERSDPQELAVRARALGLVPALNPAFVRLGDGKVLGDPEPASPDDAMRINPPSAVKPEILAPRPRVVRVPAAERAEKAQAAKKQADATQQGQVQQNVQQNGAGG